MDEGPRIVAVDDDEELRRLMVAILRRFIGSVHSFRSASSAWEYMRTSPVDILVSDVDMDGMGGLELLARVKQEFPKVRCVIVSGNPCHERPAMKSGADAFLSKPFRTRELIEALGVGSR